MHLKGLKIILKPIISVLLGFAMPMSLNSLYIRTLVGEFKFSKIQTLLRSNKTARKITFILRQNIVMKIKSNETNRMISNLRFVRSMTHRKNGRGK